MIVLPHVLEYFLNFLNFLNFLHTFSYFLIFWHTFSYFLRLQHTFSKFKTLSHTVSAFNKLSHTFSTFDTLAFKSLLSIRLFSEKIALVKHLSLSLTLIAIFGLAKYSKVRARPHIQLQSVRFLSISLLSLALSLSLTLLNSIKRLDRDPLFDYNPSFFYGIFGLHFSKVGPRPLIQLKSVGFLTISLLSLSLSLSHFMRFTSKVGPRPLMLSIF